MPTVSVVSGGSRGLGLAIVTRLLDRGDAVGTFSRNGSAALDGLAARHGSRLLDLRCDATDSDALRRFVTDVATRFGRIDHCVANAAIARDGMLGGPDVDGLAAAAAATRIPVIASGGVATLDDVAVLGRVPGIAGVITGKALYEGRFTVAEALAVLR